MGARRNQPDPNHYDGSGRPAYYDRKGKPILWDDWVDLCDDRDYCLVVETSLGYGTMLVTKWTGMNANLQLDRPIAIFETTATTKGGRIIARRKYATEAEALRGHTQVAIQLRRRPAARR